MRMQYVLLLSSSLNFLLCGYLDVSFVFQVIIGQSFNVKNGSKNRLNDFQSFIVEFDFNEKN